MTVITEKILDDLLTYLEKSISNLAKDAFERLEFEGGFDGVVDFLQSQFDIRLENLLVAQKSSTHHLESGMKNKIIQRKDKLLREISNQYAN